MRQAATFSICVGVLFAFESIHFVSSKRLRETKARVGSVLRADGGDDYLQYGHFVVPEDLIQDICTCYVTKPPDPSTCYIQDPHGLGEPPSKSHQAGVSCNTGCEAVGFLRGEVLSVDPGIKHCLANAENDGCSQNEKCKKGCGPKCKLTCKINCVTKDNKPLQLTKGKHEHQTCKWQEGTGICSKKTETPGTSGRVPIPITEDTESEEEEEEEGDED